MEEFSKKTQGFEIREIAAIFTSYRQQRKDVENLTQEILPIRTAQITTTFVRVFQR